MQNTSTRRRWLKFSLGTGFGVGLAGCVDDLNGEDGAIVDDQALSRSNWQFELEEGDTIQIEVEVIERGPAGDEVIIELETVADGTIREWEFPKGDVQRTFAYTAERPAEHTLIVTRVGEANVLVSDISNGEERFDTIYNRTVGGRLRNPHEFSEGDTLHVDASVDHDQVGEFALIFERGEGLSSTEIDGSESFTEEIESDATHRIEVNPGGGRDGEMELLVELEKDKV